MLYVHPFSSIDLKKEMKLALTTSPPPMFVSRFDRGVAYVDDGHTLPVNSIHSVEGRRVWVDSTFTFQPESGIAAGRYYALDTPQWTVLSETSQELVLKKGAWTLNITDRKINGITVHEPTAYTAGVAVSDTELAILNSNYKNSWVFLKDGAPVAITEDDLDLPMLCYLSYPQMYKAYGAVSTFYDYPFVYINNWAIALDPVDYRAFYRPYWNFSYQGAATIRGPVFENSKPAPRLQVWLYAADTGIKLRSTISDSSGYYAFRMLNSESRYFVVASNGYRVSVNMKEAARL